MTQNLLAATNELGTQYKMFFLATTNSVHILNFMLNLRLPLCCSIFMLKAHLNLNASKMYSASE